jgi:hypothetical protein
LCNQKPFTNRSKIIMWSILNGSHDRAILQIFDPPSVSNEPNEFISECYPCET